MKKKGSEPPSLFDNLDLFSQAQDVPGDVDVAQEKAEEGVTSAEGDSGAADATESKAANVAVTSVKGLTGRGPMRDLYDFNFRQYSAYVICSRAIPAIEDGLKPVQRRIMHSLKEKDDRKYTKVANIVGHAMQYHPHGDASIGDDAFAIKGSKVTGWADSTAEEHLLKKNADGKYVLTIEMYANDEFMFVAYQYVDGVLTGLPIYIKSDMIAEGSAAEVAPKAGGNFTTSANGTYTFTYDHATKSVSIAYSSDFSLEVAARPTTWYILGNGTVAGSVLNNAAWGLKDEVAQGLVSKGNGVYEITLDLYEGEEFQICSSSSWSDKHGFDSLVNPGENFTRGGNITVAVAGNYTLTLTVDPDDETKDTLTWVRNGDAGEAEETEYPADAFAIKGSKVTGWADKTDAQYLMNKNADGKFVLVIELYANDEFMFVGYEMVDEALSGLALYIKSDMIAEGSAAEVQAKAGGNFTTSANGTYTFTFDPETNKVHIAYSADFSLEIVARPTTWYILGNGATEGSVLHTSSWGLKDESVQKLVDKGNGVYEITLNLYEGDQFKICSDGSWSNAHDLSDMPNPGTNFEAAGNVKVLVAGNYTLTLTIDADDETKDTITWVRNGDCE